MGGRKKGTKNIRTIKIAQQIIRSGKRTPLEALLEIAAEFEREAAKPENSDHRLPILKEAAIVYNMAMPYIHPRVNPTELKLDDDELKHKKISIELIDSKSVIELTPEQHNEVTTAEIHEIPAPIKTV